MNQRFFTSCLRVFLCGLILFIAGCGGAKKPDGMPALHKTTLTFTQGGTPLAEATVALVPLEGAMTWPAGGVTDNNGVLRVKTQGQFEGAPAGNYKITVSKTETEGTAETGESSDEANVRPVAVSSNVKSYYLVDKKYRNAKDSDLTLEVKAGTNTETFDLGPAVRELIPVFRD